LAASGRKAANPNGATVSAAVPGSVAAVARSKWESGSTHAAGDFGVATYASRKPTRTREQRKQAADARELAATPVADPYRLQLIDPFEGSDVPEDVALFAPRPGPGAAVSVARPAPAARYAVTARGPHGSTVGNAGYGYSYRGRTPGPATAAGVIGITLGIVVGIFGVLLVSLIQVMHSTDTLGDRSIYQGSDAAHLMVGVLDLAVAALLVAGGAGLLNRRLSGRIALTVGLWVAAGLSGYWIHEHLVPFVIPAAVLCAAAGGLITAYHASVTRWIGVVPPPQPE
jgi:hypothetical protein